MANLCFVNYIVEGEQDTVNTICAALEKNKDKLPELWLGTVLKDCGIDVKEFHREYVEKYKKKSDTVLSIETYAEWNRSKFTDVLEEHFKNVAVYYDISATEYGSDVCETNDETGKYFKRYRCMSSGFEDGDEDPYDIGLKDFKTEKSLFVYLKKKTKTLATMEDVKKYNSTDSNEDKIIIIDKFTGKVLSQEEKK